VVESIDNSVKDKGLLQGDILGYLKLKTKVDEVQQLKDHLGEQLILPLMLVQNIRYTLIKLKQTIYEKNFQLFFVMQVIHRTN